MELIQTDKPTRPFVVSETFISLEGEAQFSNIPTVYVRFATCNLRCPKFNNPEDVRDEDGYAPLSFDPATYDKLEDIPLITMGCDSQYAVNPTFKHMWKHLQLDELVDEIVALLPHGQWVHPVTQQPYILSLTGGEPMLNWKRFHEIMAHPKMADCKHILVETNCTVPFKQELLDTIAEWLDGDSSRRWTWSNSPKLSASGEPWKAAIKPKVAELQQQLISLYPNQVVQYFKFVCDDKQEDYDEVQKAMDAYYEGGVRRNAPIWVMPVACTDEQQQLISRAVALKCIENGWSFSFRIQNALWGNGVGT